MLCTNADFGEVVDILKNYWLEGVLFFKVCALLCSRECVGILMGCDASMCNAIFSNSYCPLVFFILPTLFIFLGTSTTASII